MLQNKIEKLKLRDIIVAKKEVWENKQTNMIIIEGFRAIWNTQT